MPDSTLAEPIEQPVAADASINSYARLLKVLLPSMRGLCVHDGAGRRLWAAPDWNSGDVGALAREVLAMPWAPGAGFPAMVRLVDEDHAVYAFTLPRDGGTAYAAVMIALAPSGAQTEPRPLEYVRSLLTPVLACWRSEWSLRAALESRDRLTPGTVSTELAAVDAANSATNVDADAGDDFERLLDVAARKTQATLAALCVPERRISIAKTHSGHALAPDALQRAEKHLLAWLQLQQRTIVVNRLAKSGCGDSAPYKILASAVRHRSGRVIGMLALFNPPSAADFGTEAILAAEALATQLSATIETCYEPRTGLLRREAFERRAQRTFASGASVTAHSVLHLDIDRLQAVNEAFGMHVGDAVITGVAECLAATLPPDALCARLSGDRLASLLPNTNRDAAAANAERVRAAIVARGGSGTPQVTISIGVTALDPSEEPLAHALAAAEAACKRAKSRGGNHVQVCDPAAREAATPTAGCADGALLPTLRHALAADELHLVAQPILPLRATYGDLRFEILLRLRGERGELLAPDRFFPIARAHGLMPALDRWAVDHACRMLGRHAATVAEQRACFAVNIAAETLLDETFPRFVLEQIANWRVPAGALCFEISELAAVAHPAAARCCIEALHEQGCRFSLDAFGTGAGSLAMLKDLAIDTLKIDGAIIRDAIENPRSAAMVKAVAQLAKVMRLRTVAAQVETDALRTLTADLGVDYGQGFAIAKAMCLEDLLGELAVFEANISAWPLTANGVVAAAKS